MGVNGAISRSQTTSYYDTPSVNPNPERFTIKESVKVGKCLVLRVNYPDAKNFEGNKILVYEKDYVNHWEILGRTKGKLDPHFSDGEVSPVARFAPTEDGWNYALKFAQSLS